MSLVEENQKAEDNDLKYCIIGVGVNVILHF